MFRSNIGGKESWDRLTYSKDFLVHVYCLMVIRRLNNKMNGYLANEIYIQFENERKLFLII